LELLDAYEQIPELTNAALPSGYNTTEFGLFWVIDPTCQRQGYATEAAQAMIAYAFNQLRVKRVIATTEYANKASQRVMRKVGMRIVHNPSPEPSWGRISLLGRILRQ
jgi:[ribosomal protein S5]-alanine N-acetyltransferase